MRVDDCWCLIVLLDSLTLWLIVLVVCFFDLCGACVFKVGLFDGWWLCLIARAFSFLWLC